MAVEILHLFDVVRGALVDADGDRLGHVEDLIAQLGYTPRPTVTGAVVRIAVRQLFVPISRIPDLTPGHVQFAGDTVSLKRFERRPGEVLLSKDLRARHLINIQGARLIRANEIKWPTSTGAGKSWRSIPAPGWRCGVSCHTPWGTHPGRQSRRLGEHRTIRGPRPHGPPAYPLPKARPAPSRPDRRPRRSGVARRRRRDHRGRGTGPGSEADVFEELDAEHQIEFFRSRTDAEAARLLATMAPDDAADLLMELDQEHRLPVLQLLPGPATQGPSASELQPRDRRRAHEPRLSVPGGIDAGQQHVGGHPHQHRPPRGSGGGVRPRQRRPRHRHCLGGVIGPGVPTASLGSVVRPNPAHVHPDWDLHAESPAR